MRYARDPRVLWRSTSRGPVLLAPNQPQPELLGGAAAVVWEVLDDALTSEEIGRMAGELVGPIDSTAAALDLSSRGLLLEIP